LGREPLAADPDTVAMHVVRLADAGLAVSSIRVALAAIRTAHLLAGHAIATPGSPWWSRASPGPGRAGPSKKSPFPCGTHLRLVETLQAWLTAAAVAAQPVFRPITKGGQVGRGPLGNDGFIRALKRRAAAGLNPTTFSGHSLRAGFLTSRPAPTC
jgi:hypothetical protein